MDTSALVLLVSLIVYVAQAGYHGYTTDIECFQRVAVGKRLNSSDVNTTLSLGTVRLCEQECERTTCHAFSFGITTVGNGTCELAAKTPESEPVGDVDYDLFFKNPECLNRTSCFKRLAMGRSLIDKYIKRTLYCDSLKACEDACAQETVFNCEGFSFKYDTTGYDQGRCELTSVPGSKLSLTSDFNSDRDYDFYEKDRNGPKHCLYPYWQQPWFEGGQGRPEYAFGHGYGQHPNRIPGGSFGDRGRPPPPLPPPPPPPPRQPEPPNQIIPWSPPDNKGYEYGGGGHHAFGLGSGVGLPDECFVRTRTGFKLDRAVVIRSLTVPSLYDCEFACVNERKFTCNVFTYRYSLSPAVPGDNCHLGEKDYRAIDSYRDLIQDRDYDVYERNPNGRAGCQPKRYWGSDCFERVKTGLRLKPATAKYGLKVTSLSECEAACINIPYFTCRAFSYRYGPPVIGETDDNCLLTDWIMPDMNIQKDFVIDPECELYYRGSYGHGCEVGRYPQIPPIGGFERPYRPSNGFPPGFQPPSRPSGGYPPPERPAIGYIPPEKPNFVPPQKPQGGYQPPQLPERPLGGYIPPQQPERRPGSGYRPPDRPNGGYLPSQQPERQPGNGQQAPDRPTGGFIPPQQPESRPGNGQSPADRPIGGYIPPQIPNNSVGGYRPSATPDRPISGYLPPQQPERRPVGGYQPSDRPLGGYGPPQQPERPHGGSYHPPSRPTGGYTPPQQPDIRPGGGFQPPVRRPGSGYGHPQQPERPGGFPIRPSDKPYNGFLPPPPAKYPDPPNYLPPTNALPPRPRPVKPSGCSECSRPYFPPKDGGRDDFLSTNYRPYGKPLDDRYVPPPATYLPPTHVNNYRPRVTDQLCYIRYSSPARLLPSALKTAMAVRSEEDCKEECTRARDKTRFRCATISYNEGQCELSDIEQRDLRIGYDFVEDKTFWLFTWDFGSAGCYNPPPPGKPPLLNDINSYGDRGVQSTWAHYTVNGQPCRAGTVCTENPEVGVWSCPVDNGDWDYCCRSGHHCGYSEGYNYPWCYVGSADRDQWRPCSDSYYPYAHSGRKLHWPVAYLHREGPPNITLTHKPSIVDKFLQMWERDRTTPPPSTNASSTLPAEPRKQDSSTEASEKDAMTKLLNWGKSKFNGTAGEEETSTNEIISTVNGTTPTNATTT